MLLSQFRYWLGGFSEGIPEGEPPTRKQYDRILDKLNHELDYECMNFGQFAHRYFTPYQDLWNKLASAEEGKTMVITMGMLERLMHRNQRALWKAAGRAEFLDIQRAERKADEAQAEVEAEEKSGSEKANEEGSAEAPA